MTGYAASAAFMSAILLFKLMCCGLGCGQVKKRRQEHELERQQHEEEMLLMQQSKEAAQFQERERQENQFHLEQARLRSFIRIQERQGMTNVLLYFM
jgi:hypothetical protein